MLSATRLARSTQVVGRMSQLAIALVGMIWVARGEFLNACVALVAMGLSVLPSRYLPDGRAAHVTSLTSAVLLGAHVVFGMYAGLYESSHVYDKLMHVFGSGAIAVIAIVATQAFCQQRRLVLPNSFVNLFVFGATLSAGALWEIFEFGVDLTGLFVAQRGLKDTMIDLIADAFGAVLVLTSLAAARSYLKTGERPC